MPEFTGLSPHEKHPSQFAPSPLREEPRVTVWLVLAALVVALVVIMIGFKFHQPMLDRLQPVRGVCGQYGTLPGADGMCPRADLTWWNRVPMRVWFFYAALAAMIVMIAPFLVYRVKRRTGQV